MPFTSADNRLDRPAFVFVGEHPAIDFVNTIVIASGDLVDLLCSWSDLVDWLSRTGLSASPSLDLPASRRGEALKKVVELRQVWKDMVAQIIAGKKVSDDFLRLLNTLLAEEIFHETLHRNGKKGFSLVHSASRLDGAKLALALLARQIALFLAEANLSYLHRCANTASCVLYFYDTTKNHRRQWCSVASCGNRHKVAQFRKRQVKVKSEGGERPVPNGAQ
jgi:predicted RNA-binding Zn ribbon-like protein